MLLNTVKENREEELTENLIDDPQEEAHDEILREVYQVMQKRQ